MDPSSAGDLAGLGPVRPPGLGPARPPGLGPVRPPGLEPAPAGARIGALAIESGGSVSSRCAARSARKAQGGLARRRA